MRVLHDVISVEAVGVHRLRIRFDDGLDGVVDVGRLLAMSGVFEPLRELSFFRQAQVHPELQVVCLAERCRSRFRSALRKSLEEPPMTQSTTRI